MLLLHRIDVGAGLNQHLHDRHVAGLDRQHQRRLPVQIRAFHSGSCTQQCLHHPAVGDLDRFGERRIAELIGDVGSGFPGDQRVEQFVIDFEDGPVDRTGAIGLWFVDIRAGANAVERGLAIAALDHAGQGTLSACARL